MEMPLINQPTVRPTRKWDFGAVGSMIVAILIAGLTAFDVELAGKWVPVITALAGGFGFAVPAYFAKNRALSRN